MAPDISIEVIDLASPGEILQETLEERGMTGAELARRVGASEKHISQVVNGHATLTPDMALQLELALGVPARLWSTLELNYRSELRRREARAGYTKFKEWARKFPVNEMRKTGYLARDLGQGIVDRVEALLQFFGVVSDSAWESHWGFVQARFRSSPSFKPNHYALTAWLRQGEQKARSVNCSTYNESEFRSALNTIRSLTTEKPSKFQGEATQACAAAGVALTFVPSLPGLGLSGATRWLSNEKATIHLSLRHRTDDQLWFSFFHEACHVLEHRTQTIYIDSVSDEGNDPIEVRANEFARDRLIPPDDYSSFIKTWDGASRSSIENFARSIGIAPGILVGRLQHDKHLSYTQFNELKNRYKWDFE